ncbi:hypothetical protein AHMF7605_22420 [Adhaeribacter arboris]|uniref:Uncharacterized protein n=1 Tax=Adhaeribacter arboris TaxID=2072846 RepID=A0A2T2YKL5_9BACT|nr:hypothetical protein [Adhaeribacter arboris]PSR56056.1 hypothetical protein AHMF7605_22420 [Adhaeribacter arboris]
MNAYTISYKHYKVDGHKRLDVIVYQNGTWINKFLTKEAEKNKTYAANLVNALRRKEARTFPF